MGRRTERKRDEKHQRKNQWREKVGMEPLPPPRDPEMIQTGKIGQALQAKTQMQGHYIIAMESKPLVFGLGPAGTGKTHLCTVMALKALMERSISQIIITRPMVTAGQGVGFLPGELDEKFAPFFEPIQNILGPIIGRSHLENLVRSQKIVAKPLDYLRGYTFDNAFVILDEAQNTTTDQMKLFLTRIGQYSRVVVNGDIAQKDIKGLSGLEDATRRLSNCPGVDIVEFTEDDIVRSGLVKEILLRYRDRDHDSR